MSLSHSPKIVTDGLVLYIDAANVKSYPGSGTTWYDLCNNGYDFSTSVPPTFTTDMLGQKCFDFTNANGEYFESTKLSPFSGNTFAITVQATVNQNSVGSYHSILSQNEQDSFDSMSFLSYSGKFGTDHWSPGGYRLSTAADTNTIYNVCWVISEWSQHQTDGILYLNGVEQATETYSSDTVGSLVQDYFRVGNWQLSRSDMDFDGQIYELKVYNRALSVNEVKQNFNTLRGRYSL